jgi:GNAT superfamily N-acetyltransferase
MSADIQFTLAETAQARVIAELVNSAYRGESSKRGWTTEADLLGGQRTDEAKIAEMIETPGQVVLMAHLGDIREEKVIGCVNLALQNGECYLGLLTVSPVLQGQGLGKQLIAESENWARRQKCKKVKMTVITLRKELLAFYERRGYLRTGVFEKFPYGDERFGIPQRSDLRFEVLIKALI